MATTHDGTSLDQFKADVPPSNMPGRFAILKFHVDMAEVAALLAATIDGSAGDILQLWDIPAGTHILSVLVNVTTAEGAAATITIGDGDAAAGWLASMSINALAQKMTLISDANMLTGGKTYNTTDTLDITFGVAADIDLAVFDVYVACIMYAVE